MRGNDEPSMLPGGPEQNVGTCHDDLLVTHAEILADLLHLCRFFGREFRARFELSQGDANVVEDECFFHVPMSDIKILKRYCQDL